MLGVEPNERFKIKEASNPNHLYYIDEDLSLNLDKDGWDTMYSTFDILRENIEIVKIPKCEFTKEEKDILKGLKLLKFNYIARDANGRLTAYTDKPEKNYTMAIWQSQFGEITYVNPNMFLQSIDWKDSKSFEIPYFEDKTEYETDKEIIKDKLRSIFIKGNNKCDDTWCNQCEFADENVLSCENTMIVKLLIDNGFTYPKNI